VELATSELAHSNNDERLHDSGCRARFSIPGNERLTRELACGTDSRVRECREIGKRLLEVCPAGEVPPRNAHHLTAAPPAKVLEELGLPLGAGRPSGEVCRGQLALQFVTGNQLGQQPGVTRTRLRNEIARRKNKRERI